MKALGEEAQDLAAAFRDDVDRDNDAFLAMQAAARLPKGTAEEAAARTAALRAATERGILVPLEVLERSSRAAALAAEAADSGNPNSRSDAGVAALAARACAEGAYYNVLINLPGIADAAWREGVLARAAASLERTRTVADATAARVRGALEGSATTG